MNSFIPLIGLAVVALGIGIVGVTNGLHVFTHKMMDDPQLAAKCQRQRLFLMQVRTLLWLLVVIMIGGVVFFYLSGNSAENQAVSEKRAQLLPVFDKDKLWEVPDPYLAETDKQAKLIHYGRDLIAHTQDYFGENGLVRAASINGMNCQNCHLEAGTKPFGNNYFAVQSTYPQMRSRSGALETIPKRVNDCFMRSLNGQPLDTTSREMKAIVAYMRWLGTSVPKGEKPKGQGLVEMPFLPRAADPSNGQKIYAAKCASCHGGNGEGLPMPDSPRDYPPLWGVGGYSEAAGLFRLSRFAGYVKANMPFGATFQNPQLTDEEAWDLAAFVNSQPRPKHPFLDTDWPNISKKPFDHPFGPFSDTFPDIQHKYGPFEPILAFQKAHK